MASPPKGVFCPNGSTVPQLPKVCRACNAGIAVLNVLILIACTFERPGRLDNAAAMPPPRTIEVGPGSGDCLCQGRAASRQHLALQPLAPVQLPARHGRHDSCKGGGGPLLLPRSASKKITGASEGRRSELGPAGRFPRLAAFFCCCGVLTHPCAGDPPCPALSVQSIYEDYKMRREGLLLALIDGAWRPAAHGRRPVRHSLAAPPGAALAVSSKPP